MELRRNRVTTSVRTEGGLLPSDLLAKIASVGHDVPGVSDPDSVPGLSGVSEPVRNEPPVQSSWGVVPPGPKRDGPANTVVGSPSCPRWLLKMWRLLKN